MVVVVLVWVLIVVVVAVAVVVTVVAGAATNCSNVCGDAARVSLYAPVTVLPGYLWQE